MTPQNLNIRQTIEGMPLTFDGEAAGELTAVVQFNISGEEPGNYHPRRTGWTDGVYAAKVR